MLLEGTISSGRTSILIEECAALINSGIDTKEILVLCASAEKRDFFLESLKKKLTVDALIKPKIYTFSGLCHNALADMWALIENTIPDKNAKTEPNLCSMEVSQFILKSLIKDIRFKGYNSKMNLVHQLFRRYALTVQNSLNDSEVRIKSELLGESFADDAKKALDKYKIKTLELRAFDYLRQESVLPFILTNSDYFKDIKYFFADDLDEQTESVYNFMLKLKPQLKKTFIAYDKYGSSRAGFLGAKTDFHFTAQSKNLKSKSKLFSDAQKLFYAVKNQKQAELENFEIKTYARRSEMIKELLSQISGLILKGIKPSEISIVTPHIDTVLKTCIKNSDFNVCYLSGHAKLSDDGFIKGVLTALKILNGMECDPYEFRSLFYEVFEIPVKYATDPYKEEKFKNILQNLPENLSSQIYLIYENFCKDNPEKTSKIGKLFKQVADFESVFGSDYKNEFIFQLENTLISENPLSHDELPDNKVFVSTVQKIIDNEIRTKYQFWIDASSQIWIKQDSGPLYNSWVFQKNWNKKDFTLEDNIELTLDKTARILKKLTLFASEKICVYSSMFDTGGAENLEGISKFFVSTKNNESKKAHSKIIPREDQKPVLSYKGGKLAVSAVPGSGKTTILLALVIKMIESGISPENIFVLTYMESASRNFKEKLKENFPHLNLLPQISTIHGLALRILKENNNFLKIMLDEDFEVSDEARSSQILKEVLVSLCISPDEIQTYSRAISYFKLNFENSAKPLFNKVFNAYNNALRLENTIDYDDILKYALVLLKNDSEILNYYKNLAHYVIEDEAQDSSLIQQELLGLISPNFIRCGDVNQAIMNTFSNSDVKGFKDFILKSQNVKMAGSQRCAKGIYSLANRLIDVSKIGSDTKDAFLDIKMIPVKGANPVSDNPVEAKIFENPAQERIFILKRINEIFARNDSVSIGILLRSNFEAEEWASFLETNGIKAICASGSANENKEFRTILNFFNLLLKPLDNKNIFKYFKKLCDDNFYDMSFEDEKINTLKTPFITCSPDIFSQGTSSFWWDLDWFLNFSHLRPDEIALKIGIHFFDNLSNVFIVSDYIKKLGTKYKTFPEILNRLNEISGRANFSALKFYEEEDEKQTSKVNIMTIHKSKGSEFDYLFVPCATSCNFPFCLDEVELKPSSKFLENLKNKPAAVYELKLEILHENLRLLYVAITRAKKYLLFSCAQKYKFYSKMQDATPSKLFERLIEQHPIQENSTGEAKK